MGWGRSSTLSAVNKGCELVDCSASAERGLRFLGPTACGRRRVYEVGRRVQRPEARGLFDGRWRGPHFILTHAPPTDETDPSYIFLSGDVRDAVATALTGAGGRDVLRLFDALTLRASLKTLDVSASGQVVNLRLRVDKAVA